MVTPMSECGYVATDFWLMEVLMELGSAQTIFASLCRSIERMNPGIAVALLHHDQQSEELEVLAAPSLSDQIIAPLSSVNALEDARVPAKMTYKSGLKGRRTSGQWRGRVMGVNFWWLETQGPTYESAVSLLAFDSHTENLPPALDFGSVRSAMRLANRIFARQHIDLPLLRSRELEAEAAYIN